MSSPFSTPREVVRVESRSPDSGLKRPRREWSYADLEAVLIRLGLTKAQARERLAGAVEKLEAANEELTDENVLRQAVGFRDRPKSRIRTELRTRGG